MIWPIDSKFRSHPRTPLSCLPTRALRPSFFFRTIPPGQTPYSASCHATPCPAVPARPGLARNRRTLANRRAGISNVVKTVSFICATGPAVRKHTVTLPGGGAETQHSSTAPVSSDYHFDVPVCCLYLRGPPWPPSLACFLSRFSPSFLYLFFFYSSILLLFCLCPFLLSLSFSPRIDIQINTSHRQNASSIRKRFRQEGCYSLQDQMCTMPHHRKGWSKQGWSKPSRCHEQTLWSS